MAPTTIWFILGAAIVAEVVATTALARSDGLTRLSPTLLTIVGYAIAFWLLSLTLRVMPTGVVYAIWSGAGIVLITLVAWLWYGQKLDLPALVGLSLIVSGVFIINLFSRAVPH
ncbi:SMR family transporter [Afifella pfennigii]|uniref:SMR family transporter n=1 Tax=Afifella pfennigii TaxID=209897 RepID=UPI00047E1269|nr:SMR family transporter [Afifella pfennigii]